MGLLPLSYLIEYFNYTSRDHPMDFILRVDGLVFVHLRMETVGCTLIPVMASHHCVSLAWTLSPACQQDIVIATYCSYHIGSKVLVNVALWLGSLLCVRVENLVKLGLGHYVILTGQRSDLISSDHFSRLSLCQRHSVLKFRSHH